jgi:hypothetical protein
MTTLALIALLSAWFARADFALLIAASERSGTGPQALARVGVRVLMVLLPAVAAFMLSRVRTRSLYSRYLSIAVLGIAGCYLLALTPVNQGDPLRAPLFVLAVMYTALPNSLWRQLTPPILISTGLLVFHGLPFQLTGADVAGNVLVFVVFNGLGIWLVRRRLKLESDVERAWLQQGEAQRDAERALAELRILQGIIPICAHCKRVRTEMGGWQQIEQYVREHSAADFSHGICPGCFTVHYSDTGA